MFPKRSKRRGTHCLFESEHESNEKVVNYLERRVYQTKNRRLWELLLQICATSRLRQSLVLFVVQRLDWIETRRAYGRDHAADQSHQSKDCGRNCYAGWRNNQANVASFSVLRQRAVKGEIPHREGNDVGKHDPQKTSEKSDGEGLGQELHEDIEAARAQRFFDADLARALSYADQHDVHESDAADAKGESSDEGKEHLQRHRDDPKLRKLFHHAEDEQGALVVGAEIVLGCERIANRLLDAAIVVSVEIQPDHVDVIRASEVAHSGKGDVDHAVDAVLGAFLGSRLQHAYNFVRNAADPNLLAHRETAGEQFLAGLGAQHANTCAQLQIFGTVETAEIQLQVLNFLQRWIAAMNSPGIGTPFVADRLIEKRFGSDAGHFRHIHHNAVDVILR